MPLVFDGFVDGGLSNAFIGNVLTAFQLHPLYCYLFKKALSYLTGRSSL